jgi:hypothetical protein
MSQEVRSVSTEPSAQEQEAPGQVVQHRAARYLARGGINLFKEDIVDLIMILCR